jgi:RNase P subunit RPR2
MPSYTCKTPGCGNDLTTTVLRLQLAGEGYEMRMRGPARQKKPDPVVVKCQKCGAIHEYP